MEITFPVQLRFVPAARSPSSPCGNNQVWQPTAINFIYCPRTNQHLETRGNQATNSSNINPSGVGGGEILPFISNWGLFLFHPSSHFGPVRLDSSPSTSSLLRLDKYYLEVNKFTWRAPMNLFCHKWNCLIPSICMAAERGDVCSRLYNFIQSSTKKSFLLILKWLQMCNRRPFCLSAEVRDNVSVNQNPFSSLCLSLFTSEWATPKGF